MSEESITVENPVTKQVGLHKQMSKFESSLTKFLYLFPAPGGKDGKDWTAEPQAQMEGNALAD